MPCCTIPAITNRPRSRKKSSCRRATSTRFAAWPASWPKSPRCRSTRKRPGSGRSSTTWSRVRPMVWINEIPWHEMNVDDELTLLHRTSLGARAGARAAAHALPVAAPAGRHDRQRFPGLPAGHPQHRFRHHRGRRRREDRRGQRHRLAAFQRSRSATTPTWRRSRCRWSRTTRRPREFRYQAMCDVYGGIMPVRKRARRTSGSRRGTT